MRIKIINFKITQTFTMVEDLNVFVYAWRCLFGPEIKVEHHFDIEMKIDIEYLQRCRRLQKDDVIQLPNAARLQVWRVERDTVWAKTTSMIEHDLRGYHPIEMHLVYPRVHEHLSDRV